MKNKIVSLFCGEEYQGEHESPDAGNGAPMSDLSGIYPADFYGYDGARQYAGEDTFSYSIVKGAFKKPNLRIEVYRAVPKGMGIKEITKGNWVTLNKKYAKEHGDANLKNSYIIISKMVHARDLFTDGNSIAEWGYDPQAEDKNEVLKAKVRNRINKLERMSSGEKIVSLNKYPGDPYLNQDIEFFKKQLAEVLEQYKDLDYRIS